MPLSGSSLGTGAQSQILHSKAQGKAFGGIIKKLTRLINNDILPEALEFQFKPKDTEQDIADAETALKWSGIANDAVGKTLTEDEARQLMANTVSSFRDVLLDQEGNIRLWDDDTEEPDEMVVPDDFEMQQTAQPALPGQPVAPVVEDDTQTKVQKDIQATRIDFEDSFADLVSAGVNEDVNRRRFGVTARATLAKGIRSAYLDGLEDGGVPRSELSDSDSAMIARLISEQSAYVTAFSQKLFKDGGTVNDFASKAEQWWNKSVYPAYLEGLKSGDRNGMFVWSLGRTEKHCKDCKRLDGQIHRIKDYLARGLFPASDKLECGAGGHCDCKLSKARAKKARGRF
jgi:hypothetical protein